MSVEAVDLFAGAGGLSLGFELAGVRVAYALEADLWAAETYRINHPHTKLDVGDIRNISDDEIRDRVGCSPKLIIGGPPCQGFSHSNTSSRDPHDPRNTLFQDFLRFLRVLQPKACVIENVKGLVTARNASGERVLTIICEALREAGYTAAISLLDAADYGVPQHRDRVFIVGIRRDLGFTYEFPRKTHAAHDTGNTLGLFGDAPRAHVTLWDGISDLPQIMAQTSSQALAYAHQPQNEFQRRMRDRSAAILNHEPMRHSKRLSERFALIGFGESESDVADEHSPRKRGAPSELSGKKYGQNSRRQRPDRPCNTIPASSHTNFLHPSLHRNFTVRELARIQSFPDRYEFKGKRAVLSRSLLLKKGLHEDAYLDQRAQVGNAVPPLLAECLARSILASINQTSVKRAS
jgi:DNA (cytosine-5)-methyltransferase 1